MKSTVLPRRGSVVVAALAGVVAASVLTVAQTEGLERFRGTTVNMNPAGETLRIDVLRWSSEAEREDVLPLIMNQSPEDTSQLGIGPDGTEGWPIGEPRSPLVDKPSLGYVWPNGSSAGYPLKYTHRLATPDGGQRITVVTGRPLGSEDRELWTATGGPGAGTVAFTVIELQLNSDGEGEGKMSLVAEFAVDQETKTVTLASYDAAPVLLVDVKQDP